MKVRNHKSFSLEKLEGKDPMPVLLEAISYLPNYWLSAGTLLGFERDNRFIPHDTDIDVGMIGAFDQSLLPKEYQLIRTVWDDQDRPHQSAYIHGPTGIIFDILHYYENSDGYYTANEQGKLTRSKEIMKFTTKEYLGHEFNVPVDIDKYLTLWYGKWRVPVSNGKTQWK